MALSGTFGMPGAGAYPGFNPEGYNSVMNWYGKALGAGVGAGGGGGGTGTATGAYGTKPRSLAVPPSLWQQANQAVPGLTSLTNTATGVVGSELEGVLSPATIQAIENASAAWGVGAGIPATNFGTLSGNLGPRNIGLSTEQLQQQGLTDYNRMLGTVAGLQTDPSLIAGIGQYNAAVAAAPEPSAVAAEQERLWQAHFQQLMNLIGPESSPAGGTGRFSPQIVPNMALGRGGAGGSTGIARDVPSAAVGGYNLQDRYVSPFDFGLGPGLSYSNSVPGIRYGNFPSGVPGIFPDLSDPIYSAMFPEYSTDLGMGDFGG